jgi:hypothetical protein
MKPDLRPLLATIVTVATLLAALPVFAQNADTAFQDAVKAYQQSRSYEDAEKVIKLVLAMSQPPPIPDEARRHFVRAEAIFDPTSKKAEDAAQAARLAPWWADARWNTAAAFEAAGDYANAIANLKIYQFFKRDAQAVQDKIWALEAKQEKAAKDKEQAAKKAAEEAQAAREAAAKKANPDDELLARLNGVRFVMPMDDGIMGLMFRDGVATPQYFSINNSNYPLRRWVDNGRPLRFRGRKCVDYVSGGGRTFIHNYEISEDGEVVTDFIKGGKVSGGDCTYIYRREK